MLPRELDDVWTICPPVEDAIASKRLNPPDPRRIRPVNIFSNFFFTCSDFAHTVETNI